jgi:D-alanyl-D-alanine carboxypeptidase
MGARVTGCGSLAGTEWSNQMTSSDHHRRLGRRPRRLLVAGLASVAVVAFAGTPAFAADGAGKSTALLQQALDGVVAAGAPGAAVLVRHGDRTKRLGSGLGNLAPQTPMRADDRFRIGGLTKSFTATVVLQLVGETKLALDDTVEKWLPGIISNGDAIHIRQLLNHTSGIYDYASDMAYLAPYYSRDLTYVFDPLTGVQIAADHGPLFAPGTQLSYSNTNYILLGMIVEAVTGNTIAAELERRLFEPLGLNDTSFPTLSEIDGSHTHGYLFLDDGPFDVTAWSPSGSGAAAAIVSSADDVARFYRALIRGRLLPRALLKSMQTIDPVATGGVPDAGILGGGWGLGLLRESFPCAEAWGHDSEIPGYMTAAWSSRNGNRQVVVVVNSNHTHDEPVSSAMRNVLATAYCG